MWLVFSSSPWQLCGQPETAFHTQQSNGQPTNLHLGGRAESLVHRGQHGGSVTHADRALVYFFRGQPRRTQMVTLHTGRLNWRGRIREQLLFPRSKKEWRQCLK